MKALLGAIIFAGWLLMAATAVYCGFAVGVSFGLVTLGGFMFLSGILATTMRRR